MRYSTCSIMLTLHSLPERVKSFLDGTKSARLGTVSFLVAEGRSLRKKSRLAYHYFHAEERLIKTQRRTQFPSPKSVFWNNTLLRTPKYTPYLPNKLHWRSQILIAESQCRVIRYSWEEQACVEQAWSSTFFALTRQQGRASYIYIRTTVL